MNLYLLSLLGCSDYTIQTIVEKTMNTKTIKDEFETVELKADILFVLDESGSMTTEREILTEEIPNLVAKLQEQNYDSLNLRIGLTSADPLQQAYGFVDLDKDLNTKEVQEMFWESESNYCHNTYGTYQDSCEMGIDAALNSFANDPHRKDADLLVMWFSDEVDQSFNSVQSYLEGAADFKQEPFTVMEAAVIYTDDPQCWGDTQTFVTNYRYEDASDTVLDLCEPGSWDAALNPLIDHLPYLNSRFALSQEPVDVFDIIVELNGTDLSDHYWTYDGLNNSVNITYSLPAGIEVQIYYPIEK